MTSPSLSVLSAWAGEDLAGEDRLHRHAREDAQREYVLGLARPSHRWRRTWGLTLGLERVSDAVSVGLADGTPLHAHQAEAVRALEAHLTEVLCSEHVVSAADPGAPLRCYLEHATGTGKSVLACAVIDAARSGGVLVLTHRVALVDQLRSQFTDRGYGDRVIADWDDPRLLTHPNPVMVTTYQSFLRRFSIVDPTLFTVVLADEVHQSLGERGKEAVRSFPTWQWIGMTATGQLLGKDVADLYPTKVSDFALERAITNGVIAPLRAVRVPSVDPGVLGAVRMSGQDFDEQALAELLDQDLFNQSAAGFYAQTFGTLPGVVFAAGVTHATHVADALRAQKIAAQAVSGHTPRGELRALLEAYEDGRIQVLVCAQLLTEGWDSARATVCVHLAPTASQRVYLQRVGRVTRRHPDKDAGIVVDFMPPSYRDDAGVLTLHGILKRRAYIADEYVVSPDGAASRPAIDFGGVTVPIAADASDRRSWLEAHLDDVTIPSLASDDLLTWAQLAGATALTIPQMRSRVGQLNAARQDPARLALLHAAINSNPRNDVNRAALTQLTQRTDVDALETAVHIAATSDDAHVHRRLFEHVLRTCAGGVILDHHMLLELARLEPALFTRVAQENRAWRTATRTGPIIDGDRYTIEEMCREVSGMNAEGAAAVLVLLPARSAWADALIIEAAQNRFPSSIALADALLAPLRTVAAPAPDNGSPTRLAYSSG